MEEINTGKTEVAQVTRRAAIAKAAQVAVTAPAVAVLLNAYTQNAFAQVNPYAAARAGDDASLGDDFQSRVTVGDNFITLGDDYTGP